MRHSHSRTITPNLSSLQSIASNSTIIVGLSGGPDSVCLLHLLAQLKDEKNLTLIAAHLNHQWRPEAGNDAAWCQQLCDSLSISLVIATPQQLDYQPKYNGSKEEQGRLLRRYFFQSLANTHRADMIALAHHQDDQIETFFIRLLRGSSLAGLTGMKQRDGIFFRPLLTTTKADIFQYLHDHNLSYLKDSTNQSTEFLRNRIRLGLTTALETVDQRWQSKIPTAMTHLQKVDHFIAQQAEIALQKIQNPENPHELHTAQFLQLHEVLQHQLLMMLCTKYHVAITPSTKLFDEMIRFLQSGKSSSHHMHPSLIISKKCAYFYFKLL